MPLQAICLLKANIRATNPLLSTIALQTMGRRAGKRTKTKRLIIKAFANRMHRGKTKYGQKESLWKRIETAFYPKNAFPIA
jgi:hypothetical protein